MSIEYFGSFINKPICQDVLSKSEIKELVAHCVKGVDKQYKWVAVDYSGLIVVYEQRPSLTSVGNWWVNSNLFSSMKPVGGLDVYCDFWETLIWELNEGDLL